MPDSKQAKAPATQKVAPAPPPPKAKDAPAAPWELDYGDGSGNGLRFWQEEGKAARFSYSPMTPELSSSGTYSGGSPNRGELTAGQAQALWTEARRLESNTALHAASRMKGTGSFTITSPTGKGAFIVSRSHLKPWETLVKPFRKE